MASAFGAGISYHAAEPQPLTQFRRYHAVTLRTTSNDPCRLLRFDHTAGEPRDEDDDVVVVLDPGDWVEYSFERESLNTSMFE